MNEQGDDEEGTRGESLLSLGSAIEAERQRVSGPEPEKRRSAAHADAVNRHKRARARRESKQSEILAALAHEPEQEPQFLPAPEPATAKPGLIDRFFGRRKAAATEVPATVVDLVAPISTVGDLELSSTLDWIEDELARQEGEVAHVATRRETYEPAGQPEWSHISNIQDEPVAGEKTMNPSYLAPGYAAQPYPAQPQSAPGYPQAPMAAPQSYAPAYYPQPQVGYPQPQHHPYAPAPWPQQAVAPQATPPQPSYAQPPQQTAYGQPPQAYPTYPPAAYPQAPYPAQQPVYPSQPMPQQPDHFAQQADPTQASLLEIAESLREFRDAVRELTESRQRRRYF